MAMAPEDQKAVEEAQNAVSRAMAMPPGEERAAALQKAEETLAEALARAGMTSGKSTAESPPYNS